MSGHEAKPRPAPVPRKPDPNSPITATLLDADSGERVTVVLTRETAKAGDDGSLVALAKFRSGVEVPLGVSSRLLDESIAEPPCPACGCKHLYVQRDFNRALGVGIVAGAALIGAIWSGFQGTMYPLLGMLAVSTLFDAIVYSKLPPVVVCYRCLTAYRGVEPGEGIVDYDQAIADGYAFSGGVLGSGFKHGEE